MLMVHLLGEMIIFIIGAKALKATTGVHFTKDQCLEPTYTYVNDYEVLSTSSDNVFQCAVKSIVDNCKNFFFKQNTKTCVCAINDNTHSTATKNMTVLHDLIENRMSATDPTEFYMSKPLATRLCNDARYTWIPEMASCIRMGTSYTTCTSGCTADGTHLVDLPTQSKSRALNRYLFCNGFHASFWIGINDITTEGTYTWSDGSPATYTNWALSEPRTTKDHDDCGFISYNSTDKQFYWRIQSRRRGLGKSICESP